MRGNRVRWLAVAALSAGLAALSVWAWARGTAGGLSLLWTVVAGACAVLAPAVMWATRPPPFAGDLSGYLTTLAAAAAARWRTEEADRGTLDPWPLPVRWATTDRARAVMVSWFAVRGTPEDDTALPIAGRLTEIADVVTGPDAPGRLVILGEPGAGKTVLALRLVLDLLDRRAPADPVPVLLPLASWQPTSEHVRAWIAQQLASAVPALRAGIRTPRGRPTTVARQLVEAGLVLPVLDGLDELPAEQQAAAVAVLGRSLRRQDRIVLTCRTAVYERLVAREGPLARAAVAELAPLEVEDVARYLSADDPQRWAPVCAALRAAPGDPLAAALSTPLMVWLARVGYRAPHTDPRELLRLGARPAVEEVLLDGLVPAVYPNAHRLPARRLRFLARLLMRLNTYDISWRQLAWIGLGALFVELAGSFALLFAGCFDIGAGRPGRGLIWCVAAALLLAGAVLNASTAIGPIKIREWGLARLRWSAFAQALTVAVLVGAAAQSAPISGHRYGAADALRHGLGPGLLAALLWVAGYTPWGRSALTRTFYILTGRLPWRLTAFLDDAWRRGVLRRVGSVYQFRHARLQERLARR